MKYIYIIFFIFFSLGVQAQELSTDKDLYQFVLEMGFINSVNAEDSTIKNLEINEGLIRQKYPEFIDINNEIDYKQLLVAVFGALAYVDDQNKLLLFQYSVLKTDIENLIISNGNKFDKIEYKIERIEQEIQP